MNSHHTSLLGLAETGRFSSLSLGVLCLSLLACNTNSPEAAKADLVKLCDRYAVALDKPVDAQGGPAFVSTLTEWEGSGVTERALAFVDDIQFNGPFEAVEPKLTDESEVRRLRLGMSKDDFLSILRRRASKYEIDLPDCPGWASQLHQNVAGTHLSPGVADFCEAFDTAERKDWPTAPKAEFQHRWNLAEKAWRATNPPFEDIVAFIDSLSALPAAERATTFEPRVSTFLRGARLPNPCVTVGIYTRHFANE